MPKKPRRDNPKRRELTTVHSAGAAANTLLQRITRRAQVVLPPAGGLAEGWPQRLRALLPEEQRPHLLDVLEKADELVLMVDAAVWAGRIRLSLPELAAVAGSRKLVVRLNPQGARIR